MRRIVFYCSRDESDVYEYPDNVSDEQLTEDAYQWVCDNVDGYWEEVDE